MNPADIPLPSASSSREPSDTVVFDYNGRRISLLMSSAWDRRPVVTLDIICDGVGVAWQEDEDGIVIREFLSQDERLDSVRHAIAAIVDRFVARSNA